MWSSRRTRMAQLLRGKPTILTSRKIMPIFGTPAFHQHLYACG
jgi:hypothetical protein